MGQEPKYLGDRPKNAPAFSAFPPSMAVRWPKEAARGGMIPVAASILLRLHHPLSIDPQLIRDIAFVLGDARKTGMPDFGFDGVIVSNLNSHRDDFLR